MAICSVIKYDGDLQTLVYKHPEHDFNTKSQLIVRESQEALFMQDGKALDLFPAGRYTLTTQNIPLIGKFVRFATGGENPFTCEVYFINKTLRMRIKWGTTEQLSFTDPESGLIMDIGARGEMEVSVSDSRKLLLTLVGTTTSLNTDDIKSYFRTKIISKVKTYLAGTIIEQKLRIFDIDRNLDTFSNALRTKLAPEFAQYGLNLFSFTVEAIHRSDGNNSTYEQSKNRNNKRIFDNQDLDDEIALQRKRVQFHNEVELMNQQTQSTKTLIDSQALAAKRQLEGYTFADEQNIQIQKQILNNPNVAGITNAAVTFAVTEGIVKGATEAVSSTIRTSASPTVQNDITRNRQELAQTQPVKKLRCSCGAIVLSTDKFCGNCGRTFVKSVFVVCPSCKQKVKKGKFCSACGSSMQSGRTCSKCGKTYPADAKFCSDCGEKL